MDEQPSEEADTPSSEATDGYPEPEDTHKGDDGAGHLDGPAPDYLQRMGFDTMRAYLDFVDDGWERLGFRRRRLGTRREKPKRRAVEARLPSREIADLAPERRKRRTETYASQLNVKLTDSQHEDLLRAALLYGVTATTFARLLINRGVQAALESEGD
jgi:hypothetical protein